MGVRYVHLEIAYDVKLEVFSNISHSFFIKLFHPAIIISSFQATVLFLYYQRFSDVERV